MVQRAENRLRRDKRARLLVDLTPLSVATEEVAAPADLAEVNEISHDGPTYFGELEPETLGNLTSIKGLYGNSGVPRVFAVKTDASGNNYFMFAPEPDATYTLRASYFASITNGSELSSSNPTNRFILENPDIYVYATLAESAPYLREDERLGIWEGILDARLNALEQETQDKLHGGTFSNGPRRVF
jgi:hypothetical protein